ncbi:hypothetical protein QAD02_002720 [Eretmocerus hayati]|uniref:Uncharacterized protein n=1 Tax=Eretmocerus hayati TaxID=131215 RepID=A0ACC2NKM7_9HYME|nr:hypothetical protein QAD02_002720 [Eretmocerus hayati]
MTDKIRNLSITFGTGDGEDYTFVAQFKVRGNGDELIGFYYQDKKTATWLLLKSQNDILLPDGSSYHCLRETFIARGSEDANRIISLTLSNLQLQMDTDSFGKVIDCTGFMSIPIWTGIFVTIILAVIVIWGLTMIVDIRTMDHFDDPKSKTIAISAQE